MDDNKKQKIKDSIIDLEKILSKENIALTETEKNSIYKYLTKEISSDTLLNILYRNSK